MFEAKQGVPVTSTSPAWIMLNNLQYITDRITLKLTTYNFTVTLMYTAKMKVFICDELLLHAGKRCSCQSTQLGNIP